MYHPWSAKVRVVNMQPIITRRSTAEASEVKEVLSSGVEADEILLHGWNDGMSSAIVPLETLDKWHLMWYRIFTTGSILCGYEHHGGQDFDKKIMVRCL